MNRIAAWWAAWQWVAILMVVCLILLTLNLYQLHRALNAPLRHANKAMADSLTRIEGVAAARNKDDARLMADLDAIALRAQAVRTEYRTVVRDRPLPPGCAPGRERVDAVNRGLSGRPSTAK